MNKDLNIGFKMRIERMELVGYKRLSLSGINSFIYTPDTSIVLQTILGTNGSGKSSLLWELWPLPANKEDFNTNGYKELWINYNSKEYKLRNEFDTKESRYSFIVDGNELNDGFKIEMYRNLCLDHFRVNNEIRNLCLGKELLTWMSPARRRYWMVKISDTDYTYAMGVYKSLVEAHRDTVGVVKRLKGRLVSEESKRVKKEVLETLETDCKNIRKLIHEIYNMKENQKESKSDIESNLESTYSFLQRNLNELGLSNLEIFRQSGYNDIEEIKQKKLILENEVIGLKKTSELLFKQHDELNKKYNLLIKSGKETIEQLETNIDELIEKIKVEEGLLTFPNVRFESNPNELKSNFDNIYNELYDNILNLPVNDGVYDSKKKNEYEEKVIQLGFKIDKLNHQIGKINAQIEHADKHVTLGNVKCPQCNFEFKLHFNDAELKVMNSKLNSFKEELELLKKKRVSLIDYVRQTNEYTNNYRLVLRVMKSISDLNYYYAELMKDNRLLLNPGAVANDLHLISEDLEIKCKIQVYKDKVIELKNQMELKKSLSSDTLVDIENNLRKINNELEERTSTIIEKNSEIKYIDNLLNQFDKIETIRSNILKHKNQIDNSIKDYIKARFQELLNESVLTLQTVLARKEDALSQANNQEFIIKDIEEQIDLAQMNERISKATHIALSPTVGAIAYGLQSFINQFIDSINRIINTIWLYPLKLIPFELDEDNTELDYKFPFIKNNESRINKDVALGSESMIDIFNFAFRFCVIKQLGLTHLPLYLDEFESAFDDGHREKAIYFIKRLIDEKAFNQIFMVSHYEHNHGALSSLSQTCVLNKDNLLLVNDAKINEHVIIN